MPTGATYLIWKTCFFVFLLHWQTNKQILSKNFTLKNDQTKNCNETATTETEIETEKQVHKLCLNF